MLFYCKIEGRKLGHIRRDKNVNYLAVILGDWGTLLNYTKADLDGKRVLIARILLKGSRDKHLCNCRLGLEQSKKRLVVSVKKEERRLKDNILGSELLQIPRTSFNRGKLKDIPQGRTRS